MYVKYLSVRCAKSSLCVFLSQTQSNVSSFLLFSFIFVCFFIFTVAARRQQLRWQIACAFRSVVGYIISFFLYSLSQYICFCFISVSIRFCHFILRISSVHCPLVLLCYLRLFLAAVSVSATAFQCCCCAVVVLFLTHTIC